jgi:signal transduction histidine kinase
MVGDPKLLSRCSTISCPTPSNIRRAAASSGRRSARIESGRPAMVTVEDNGIGIPPVDIDRLFERYFRGSNVSGIVGTGVGLNLVKMVVDLRGLPR